MGLEFFDGFLAKRASEQNSRDHNDNLDRRNFGNNSQHTDTTLNFQNGSKGWYLVHFLQFLQMYIQHYKRAGDCALTNLVYIAGDYTGPVQNNYASGPPTKAAMTSPPVQPKSIANILVLPMLSLMFLNAILIFILIKTLRQGQKKKKTSS